jgi:hypothetical protein
LADPGNKPLSSAKVKPADANDGRMSALRTLCETGHIPSAGRRTPTRRSLAQPPDDHAPQGRDKRDLFPSIPALRRGESSQLTTTSQAVDGLRGSFDNAVCVE